jgi:hypothetical protein
MDELRFHTDLLYRSIARARAEKFHQGVDEQIIEARSRAPEPTRFDYPRFKVPLPRLAPIRFWDSDPCIMETLEVAEFERVLVKAKEGATFWAWKCTRDGRHYL